MREQFDEIKQRPFQYQAPPAQPTQPFQWTPETAFGSIARYGMPEGAKWSNERSTADNSTWNHIMQLMMQKAMNEKYPDYDWKTKGRKVGLADIDKQATAIQEFK